MRYFTATHEELDWPLPGFMEPVSTVPAGDGVTDLGERFPELAGRGVELGEYATLFGVRRLLQESWREDGPPAADEMVGISHYRRFAVTRPTGTQTFLVGEVTSRVFADLPDDLFLPPPGAIMVPALVDFGGSVQGFYAHHQPVRDLLHFMGLAVDLGVVDDRSVADFLSGHRMMPTASVSVVPASWLVATLEQLERVAEAFGATVATPREGYQRRARGFCCEWLHGMLLGQLLSGWPADRVIMNRALLVSPEPPHRPGS